MGDYSPFENLRASIQHPAHGEGLLDCLAKVGTEDTAL